MTFADIAEGLLVRAGAELDLGQAARLARVERAELRAALREAGLGGDLGLALARALGEERRHGDEHEHGQRHDDDGGDRQLEPLVHVFHMAGRHKYIF